MSRITGSHRTNRSIRAIARERRSTWRMINEQTSGTMRDELIIMHQQHIAAAGN